MFETGARRWIVAVTLLIGVLVGVVVTVALPPGERTLAAVAYPTHLIMSVVLPFLGVLLGRDVRTAVVAGVSAGLFGDLVAVVAAAVAGSAAPDPWAGAGVILLGGVLVQCVANLTGTGLGVLIRPAWLACLATIVVPLGLSVLLSLAGPAAPLAAWVTPFPVAESLLSGEMDATGWARWTVVALIWGVGLNALAARRPRPATRV
ncbi:hypothetical protein [Catenuloplanes atrovinosus]|uniref:Small basic protein n=1 Tax=Catenuloplanes atrovinosus TaxID=137266 RepID=A0AAE4C9F4_9ACTN|nr:hypothetical protein [Catenuloplanes atrovinosus]MDR7274754.1 small basic protein [Catenuloplanes atrovinosus]